MTSSAASTIDPTDLASFTEHLGTSTRILALLGAGLSASSGLPTFRGAGGYWRTYDAIALATPRAFRADPGLVWQFYSYRRHMALNAKPNRAHLALAALAEKRPGFLTLSQNVDGLSPRAGHPAKQIKYLHGNLFDVKCFDEGCGYLRENDLDDPIVPALAIPEDSNEMMHEELQAKTGKANLATLGRVVAKTSALIKEQDIGDASVPLSSIPTSELPHCPQCKTNLLRPGVVWFGEALPEGVMDDVHDWISSVPRIDLMLVIGTSSKVYPAAGYTEIARKKGARVAVINTDRADAVGMRDGDWFFGGDAGEIVPEILRSVVGEVAPYEDQSE